MICTEQVAEPVVPVAVTGQDAVGPKLTVPVGVASVPRVELSLTVAVHVIGWFTATLDGEHNTAIVVPRKLTVIMLVLWLVECVVSGL